MSAELAIDLIQAFEQGIICTRGAISEDVIAASRTSPVADVRYAPNTVSKVYLARRANRRREIVTDAKSIAMFGPLVRCEAKVDVHWQHVYACCT